MLGKRQLKKLPPGSLLIHQDENGRFSATNELVLQNLLISTELDFQLIADLTNISLGKVVEIYLKYQQYIDKVIVTEEEADKDNTAIENCLTLLSEHIAQVIEWQSKSETKLLKATDLTNILRIEHEYAIFCQTQARHACDIFGRGAAGGFRGPSRG